MSQLKETELLTALSEPTRLRIAALLIGGELCVCNLTQSLSIPQSTVSRHMARLRQAGLVLDRREGKWIHYRLAGDGDPFWNGIRQLLSGLDQKEPFKSDRKALLASKLNQSNCEINDQRSRGK